MLGEDSINYTPGDGKVVSVSAYDMDGHCQKVLASLHEVAVQAQNVCAVLKCVVNKHTITALTVHSSPNVSTF